MTVKKFIGKSTGFPDLNKISVERFFSAFGQMTKEDAESFINNPSNAYEIGKFAYRASCQDKVYAFNGFKPRYSFDGSTCFSTLVSING